MYLNYEGTSDLSSTSHKHIQTGGGFIDKLKKYFGEVPEKEISEKKQEENNNNLYSNVTVGKLNPQIYENMNSDEITNAMLSAAYVKEYTTVAYIIKNFYEKLDFTKQVKGDGSTILHYFARDFAMIQGTDPIITAEDVNFVKRFVRKIIGNIVNKIPLFVVITLGHPNIDKFINLQDKDGNTAVFIAQKSNNYAFIDILLSFGASLEICNNLGLQVQCVTETESDRLSLSKNCKFSETKCKQQNSDTYKSDEFMSINVEQTKGIKSYDPYKRFFETTKKNSFSETSEIPTQTTGTINAASNAQTLAQPAVTTEEDLIRISKSYREKYGDQFKNLDSFLSEKTNSIPKNSAENQINDIPTSELLNNLTIPQDKVNTPSSEKNTEKFINELVTQLRTNYPSSTKQQQQQQQQQQQLPQQQFTMTGGKKKTNKIQGTRDLFEYKTKDRKFAKLDFYGGRSSTITSEKAMHSMQRVMEQTVRDTEAEIIATIKKIMKITDDEVARDYRSGIWYLFKNEKGDSINNLSRLDRTLEFQKFINEERLKKVDLKEAKKRRMENKQKQEERKTSSSSSSSSISTTKTTTSSSPNSPAPIKKKETKASKASKVNEGSRKSVHVSEYSLGSDLSDLKFSDSSFYNFNNKGVMPSNTSSTFNSYTSSSRF